MLNLKSNWNVELSSDRTYIVFTMVLIFLVFGGRVILILINIIVFRIFALLSKSNKKSIKLNLDKKRFKKNSTHLIFVIFILIYFLAILGFRFNRIDVDHVAGICRWLT